MNEKEDKIEVGKESEQNSSNLTEEKENMWCSKSSQLRKENYKRKRR